MLAVTFRRRAALTAITETATSRIVGSSELHEARQPRDELAPQHRLRKDCGKMENAA